MSRLFKNLVDKEFKKILWGKVKFNFDDILEKIYSGNQGNLESNIIVKDKSLYKDLVLRGDLNHSGMCRHFELSANRSSGRRAPL